MLETLKKQFEKRKDIIRFVLAGTFIWSLLAHAFSFFNLIPQHDGINHSYRYSGAWEISLGRFGLLVFDRIRGVMTVPWLTGIFATLYIAVTVFCICEILEINKKTYVLLISAFLSVNASVLDINSTFGYALDAYMLSVMMATLGAMVLVKGKSWKSIITSSVLISISLGLYQAEIIVAVMILAMSLLRDALNNVELNRTIKNIGRYVGGLILASAGYLFCYKVILTVTNISAASSYNGISSVKTLEVQSIWGNLLGNLVALLKLFFSNEAVSGKFAQVGNLILFFTVLVVFVWNLMKKRRDLSRANLILVILCVVAIPVLSIAISVLMSRNMPSLYICYSIFMLYVLVVLMWQESGTKLEKGVSNKMELALVGASLLIIFSNIAYCNNVYSYQKLMYDRTQCVATNTLYELNRVEKYIPGETPVAIVMDDIISNPNIAWIPFEKSWLSSNRKLNTTYAYTFSNFLYILGQDINFTEDYEFSDEEKEKISEMPLYPMDGHIQWVGDVVVIKMSNTAY